MLERYPRRKLCGTILLKLALTFTAIALQTTALKANDSDFYPKLICGKVPAGATVYYGRTHREIKSSLVTYQSKNTTTLFDLRQRFAVINRSGCYIKFLTSDISEVANRNIRATGTFSEVLLRKSDPRIKKTMFQNFDGPRLLGLVSKEAAKCVEVFLKTHADISNAYSDNENDRLAASEQIYNEYRGCLKDVALALDERGFIGVFEGAAGGINAFTYVDDQLTVWSIKSW